MERATHQDTDVEMLFALSPPVAGHPSKLATSRQYARLAAVVASVIAAAIVLTATALA